MNRFVFLLPLTVSLTAAQVGFDAPLRGFVAGDSGSLRLLSGVPGSLVAGLALRSGVLAAASSRRHTVIKTSAGIEVLRGEEALWMGDAPEGPAIFAFDRAGIPASVYFPATRQSVLWDGQAFQPGWELGEGEVLAAAARSAGTVALAVRSGDDVRLETRSLRDGALLAVEAAPQARSGPLWLGADGSMVYWDGEALRVRAHGGPELRFPLVRRPAAIEQAGEDLVAARCGGQSFGIWLVPRQVRLFELPAEPAEDLQ